MMQNQEDLKDTLNCTLCFSKAQALLLGVNSFLLKSCSWQVEEEGGDTAQAKVANEMQQRKGQMLF